MEKKEIENFLEKLVENEDVDFEKVRKNLEKMHDKIVFLTEEEILKKEEEKSSEREEALFDLMKCLLFVTKDFGKTIKRYNTLLDVMIETIGEEDAMEIYGKMLLKSNLDELMFDIMAKPVNFKGDCKENEKEEEKEKQKLS